MKRQLHSGARWLFRISTYVVVLLVGVLGSILLPNYFTQKFDITSIYFIKVLAGSIIIALVIGEVYARMAYNRWMYEFTPESLRTERGIIWKKYSNVPYERIQNVEIHRGIIGRFLGFSDVRLQTAGYSASALSEGYLPAIEKDEAENIRNFVIKHVSTHHRER